MKSAFGKFIIAGGKILLVLSAVILAGIPLIAGYGVYILTILVGILSGLMLRMLSSPIALIIVGAIALYLVRRYRTRHNRL